MWIVCFSGGLGNQMFQYAFYKSLLQRYNDINISADIVFILGPKEHNGFELDKIFDISLPICDKWTSMMSTDFCRTFVQKSKILELFHRALRRLFGKDVISIIPNKATAYIPEVYELNIEKDYIFMGYWINHNYFQGITQDIRKDFSFKTFKDEMNIQYKTMIDKSQSVSIHVRRTDYLEHDLVHLSLDYYKEAVNIILGKIENPKFFIFSDDVTYIKENFDFLHDYVFVEGNEGENSYKDMQLMSYCKHNIVANSTFSFWGAFLNDNPDKIVIEPTHISKEMLYPKICENCIQIECI